MTSSRSSDSEPLGLRSCSTSSFHLETISDPSDDEMEAQPPRILHIGHGSDFWMTPITPSSTVIWTPPKAIATTDVTICYVSDLRGHDILGFKYPENVQEVHFDGFISQKNFDKLVTPLAKLKLLDIHISTLGHLNLHKRTKYVNYLPMSLLESLQISSHQFTLDHALQSNMDKIVNNCCILLSKVFPSLNFLAISLPLIRQKEDQILEAIMRNMKNHRRTLKSLNLESTFEVEAGHLDEETSPTLPNLDLELTYLKNIQIHSFHYFSTHKTHSTAFWRKFLQTQKNLEYLQFWCGSKYYPLPTVLILHNCQHLHTVALNINPLSGKSPARRISVDCTIFQDCPLLKTLVLKAKPRLLSEKANFSRKSDLANFHLISKGLEHLRLIHLGLTKADARIIARDMPELTILYLEDIGEDQGLGLSIEDLAHLLGKKSLTTLDVHSGINKDSFNEVSDEQAGGFCIVAKILFKTHNPQSFRAVLDSNGEYDIVDDLGYDDDEFLVEKEILHQDQAEDPFTSERDVVGFRSQTSEVGFSQSEDEPGNNNWDRKGSSRVKSKTRLPLRTSTKYLMSRNKSAQRNNPPTIYEEDEKLSGSSSDENILDFGSTRSSVVFN